MSVDVFFASLEPATPVYHHVPDWHHGEGRQGEEVVCNTFVNASDRTPIGNNDGVALPEDVVAPCGIPVYHRKPPADELWDKATVLVLNSSRMVSQGELIPLRHAKKFGRPCGRCYPKETS